jgi:phosphoribosylaminoimidazole-succinocarboxamide synthase
MTSFAEGKTKRIIAGPQPHTVILQAVNRLTGGDAARVAEIEAIGSFKTEQAANCFQLLAGTGIPTAYVDRQSDHELLCRDCIMLPIEFVVRRYAFGSYLKRAPQFRTEGAPHRFDDLVLEQFHKMSVVSTPASDTPTMMSENAARDQYLANGEWAEGVYTDPYIVTGEDAWQLYSAKAPVEGDALMSVKPELSGADLQTILDTIVRPTFDVLEKAWGQIETVHGPVTLVDAKFEVGIDRETGAYLLADVVDNDSWRIWPGGDPSKQLDKQAFRDGEAESLVTENYKLVAALTRRFLEN